GHVHVATVAARSVTVIGVTDEGVARAVAQPSSDWWRPTRSLATWLTGLLVFQAVSSVALAVVDDGDAWVRVHDALKLQTGDVAQRQLSNALQDVQPWFSIYGWISTGVLVFAILWTYRSTRNARAAGRVGARWTPGWTIAGWLVPILNLLLPYQAWSD